MLAIAAFASGVRPNLYLTGSLGTAVMAEWSLRGANLRTAFWMTVRRAQDRAQSRNTWLPLAQSSKPDTKHSSAFVRSAVSKNESKYILSMFSANPLQNSLFVAYV